MSLESVKLAKGLLAKHASSDFGGMVVVSEYIAQEAVELAGKVPDFSFAYIVSRTERDKAHGITAESTRIEFQSRMDLFVQLEKEGFCTLKSIQ